MQKNRWVYAILLAALSGFCAESSIGSYLWLFFTPWGLLVTLPIYGLHILILTRLATLNGPPKLYVLYAAGSILGLYEAYITKMLFIHTWGPHQLSFIGVSWFAVSILVFMYHPIFAFMIPLFISELVVVGNRKGESLVPQKLRDLALRNPMALPIILGVWIGLYHGANPARWQSVGPAFSDGLFILCIVALSRKFLIHKEQGIMDLAPRAKAFVVLLVLLLGIFALFMFTMRPEALPGLAGYVTILCMYLLYSVVIFGRPSRIRESNDSADYEPPLLGVKHFACAIAIWLLVSIVLASLPPLFGLVIYALFSISGFLAGFVAVAWMLFTYSRDRSVSVP